MQVIIMYGILRAYSPKVLYNKQIEILIQFVSSAIKVTTINKKKSWLLICIYINIKENIIFVLYLQDKKNKQLKFEILLMFQSGSK